MAKKKKATKRIFGSGAFRDIDDTKLQYRRCLSHRVLKSFAEFMRKHNTMTDGTRRNEENWKQGFPQESFMDSKFRHFMYSWETYEEFGDLKELIESLNAELFNVMGWLDLLLRPGMTIDKFRKTMEDLEKETVHYVSCIKSKIGTRRSNLTKCGLNRTRSPFKVTTKIGKVTCEDCKDLLKKRSKRKPKKITDTRSKSRKQKDKEYFEKTLKRIEQRKKAKKKEPKLHYKPRGKAATFCGLSSFIGVKTTPNKKRIYIAGNGCCNCLKKLAALSRAKSSVEADKIITGIPAIDKRKKEQRVHYLPLSRKSTKQGTICGLIVLDNLKTTPHKYHVKCKTCEK